MIFLIMICLDDEDVDDDDDVDDVDDEILLIKRIESK